ncbi:hypothetical protein GCM10009760_62530 [Kitasatospora kazusensis]|uniref:Uncharacterized protein n=1 Tax=Kitasatospora kazusensis TaxID=407974 RepID=A0ABN1ZL55_9ACTN
MHRYRCGVCRTVSDHQYPFEAYDEQRRHIDAVHDGREPEQQSITPVDAPPASARPLPWTSPAPAWESANRQLLRGAVTLVTRSKLSLTVTLLVVAFLGWRVYELFSNLAAALPPPRPWPTPSAPLAPPADHP